MLMGTSALPIHADGDISAPVQKDNALSKIKCVPVSRAVATMRRFTSYARHVASTECMLRHDSR